MRSGQFSDVGIQNPDLRSSLLRILMVLTIILLVLNIFIQLGQFKSISHNVAGWLILIMLIIIPLSPLVSIVKTMAFILTGRLHFPDNRVGECIIGEDGLEFTVFRQVVVDPGRGQPTTPGALLTLRFKVTNMSPGVNKFYSLLPLMFYLGDKGFRSKTFTIHGDHCMSIYEWDTITDAENYLQSIALKTILLRSVTGFFTYTIQPLD